MLTSMAPSSLFGTSCNSLGSEFVDKEDLFLPGTCSCTTSGEPSDVISIVYPVLQLLRTEPGDDGLGEGDEEGGKVLENGRRFDDKHERRSCLPNAWLK